MPIDLDDLSLAELMARHPATVRVFIDRHMLCVGCPIAPFHTLVEAADEHGLILDELRRAVRRSIDTPTDSPASARRRSAPADGGPPR
jgi:hybrid cluster-associated redox disulfide protein